MNKIEFPLLKEGGKHIDTYVKFALNNFILNGDNITYNPNLKFATEEPGCVAFQIKINNKLAMIDLQDSPDEYRQIEGTKIYEPEALDMPIFKVAMRPDLPYSKNIYPYGPFYVWNNKTTKDLEKLLSYGNIYNPFANNNIINTCSRKYPHTRAIAYSKLDENNKNVNFIRSRISQYAHWDRLGHCLGVLNISGSNTNVVDKAPIEAMFLGVCVVHNDIDILLPHNEQLIKNKHYICLEDDYSDINDKVNFLYENRELAQEIGHSARDLMLRTSTPKTRSSWMMKIMDKYYNRGII